MNYFNFHIGDFNSSTRHLSIIERAIYRDLLDIYYETEKPISVDELDRIFRKILCKSEEEKNIAMSILDEFFELRDGNYHNRRCDKDLEEYRAKLFNLSKAGKASAAKRKGQHQSSDDEQQNNGCSSDDPNQDPRSKIQQPISKNQKLNLEVCSVEDLLKLWNPTIDTVNQYLQISGLPNITDTDFKKKKPEFLAYYRLQIIKGKLDGTELMGKFISWITNQKEKINDKKQEIKRKGESPWKKDENLEKL